MEVPYHPWCVWKCCRGLPTHPLVLHMESLPKARDASEGESSEGEPSDDKATLPALPPTSSGPDSLHGDPEPQVGAPPATSAAQQVRPVTSWHHPFQGPSVWRST